MKYEYYQHSMAFQESIKMRKTKQYRAEISRELIIGLELVIH